MFISYLLYMSGSQRTVLIQKGEKNEHWGEKLLATTEWGLIDFDPQGKTTWSEEILCLMTSIWIYRCSLEKK